MNRLKNTCFPNEYGDRPFEPINRSQYVKPKELKLVPSSKGMTSTPMKAGVTTMKPVPIYVRDNPRLPSLANALAYRWYERVKRAGLLETKKPALLDYFADKKKETLRKDIEKKIAQKYSPEEIGEMQANGSLEKAVRMIADDTKRAQLDKGYDSRVIGHAYDDFGLNNLTALTTMESLEHSDDYLDARALYEQQIKHRSNKLTSDKFRTEMLEIEDESLGKEGIATQATGAVAHQTGGTADGNEVYFYKIPTLRRKTEYYKGTAAPPPVNEMYVLKRAGHTGTRPMALVERVQHADRHALEAKHEAEEAKKEAEEAKKAAKEIQRTADINNALGLNYLVDKTIALKDFNLLQNAGYNFEKLKGSLAGYTKNTSSIYRLQHTNKRGNPYYTNYMMTNPPATHSVKASKSRK